MLKIQLISDIHLEWRYDQGANFSWLKPVAPILILAGDISIFGNGTKKYYTLFRKFLEYCSESFELIIYVPGNHEFYNEKQPALDIDTIDNKIRLICSEFPKVKYLMNSSFKMTAFDSKGKAHIYKFIGTTLWGHIPQPLKFEIETHKNCFSQIWINKAPMTIESMNREHKNAIKFLEQSIKQATKEGSKAIVITHHQPFMTSKNFCYMDMSDDVMHLIQPPVGIWCFGHMHGHTDRHLGKVRLIQNGLGYTQNERTGYVKGFHVNFT